MIGVNYTNFRRNLKSHMDAAAENFEPILVTRKGENIVVLSESVYNNLLENIYLMGNKANYDHLMMSKRQIEEGKGKARDLIVVEDE